MTNKTPSRKSKGADAWPKRELFLFEPKTLFIIIITSVLTLLIAFFGDNGAKFFTSVISSVPAHDPFDGTVYPIQKVPNWVKLTEAERKMKYSELPATKLIAIPTYNPTRLAIPVDKLVWNNATDDQIRNEKITYSVPYLGSYQLNGLENDGSHPAVDIKIPEGTPIYAIANGTVIKADTGNGGFGKHVVLQHNDFPSADDKTKTQKLFSSYSHMSALSVSVNTVVKKGQLLGYSGMTGTATTPHLHFQIDNDNAAWHPYWPFTTADMNAAGYSFFDAINNGLGQSNGIANTISPMKYVQTYLGASAVVASNGGTTTTSGSTTSETIVTFAVQMLPSVTPPTEAGSARFIVQAFDSKGTLLTNPNFTQTVNVALANGNGKLSRTTLDNAALKTGITTVNVSALKAGTDRVVVIYQGKEFTSAEYTIGGATASTNSTTTTTPVVTTPSTTTPATPAVTVGGFFITTERTGMRVGETQQIKVQAADENAAALHSNFSLKANPIFEVQGRLGSSNKSTLTATDFVNGEAVITFTASAPGTTTAWIQYAGQNFYGTEFQIWDAPLSGSAEEPVLTADLAGTQPGPIIPIPEVNPDATFIPPFTDISADSKYADALVYLKEKSLVAGYGDGSFKPENVVNRAEAIAFVLKAIKENVKEEITKTFPDVNQTAWYAKFVSTAFELGFVKGYPDGTFGPEREVNMAEFFTMLFVAAKTDIDPEITITLPQGVAGDQWYSPYIQEAIRQNILIVREGETVEPQRPLSRGEIALYLFRLALNQTTDSQLIF